MADRNYCLYVKQDLSDLPKIKQIVEDPGSKSRFLHFLSSTLSVVLFNLSYVLSIYTSTKLLMII